MKRITASPIALVGFGALMLSTGLSCGVRTETPECVTGDLKSLQALFKGDSTASLSPEWFKNARACTFGEYQILTPVDGVATQLIILKNKQPVFSRSADYTMVYDETSSRPAVFWSHDPNQKDLSFLSYRFYDAPLGGFVEVTDRGPNGILDQRSTEIPEKPIKTEFMVGTQWLELVKQDGAYGTVLDGTFMSMSAARQKLSERDSRGAK